MRLNLITTTGEALEPIELPELPRIGDTIDHPQTGGTVWMITRTHWAVADRTMTLHLARSALNPLRPDRPVFAVGEGVH
jgi:hypothetical protein